MPYLLLIPRRAASAALLTTALAVAAGCGGSTGPGDARVDAVALSDSAVALRVQDEAALVARPARADGGELVGRRVFWSVRDTTIAQVSQSGVIRAVRVGTTEVAASVEGQAAVARVTVLPRPVANLQITPATLRLVMNDRQQLSARPLNDVGAPADAPVTWTSLTPAVVSVTPTGEVRGVAPGVGSVQAAAEGVTATAAVVVAPVPVASVTVAPQSPSLVVGATTTLTATTLDAGGTALTGREVSWTSADPAIAVVSSTGQVTALAPGSVVITATAEGQTARTTVSVRPVPVAAVRVTPDASSIGVGGTVRLGAVVTDAAGNALAGRAVTFTSNNPAVARVADDGTVTGQAAGDATITATSEGVSGTGTVRVTATAQAAVATVEVTPASVTLTQGETRVFTATPRAANGTVLTGRAVTWSSGGSSVITVSANGVATAVGPGTAQVLARVEGVTGTASVTVVRPAVAFVQVAPSTATLPAGTSTTLTATLRDAQNNPLTGRVVVWSTSDAAVATVSSDGRVQAVGPGQATVRATSEGSSGLATITVTAVVRVSPEAATVRDRGNTNRTVQLVATDHTGRVLTGADVTWQSSNPGVATVDTTGLVRGISSGSGTATATITATYRGTSASATITVRRD